MDIIEYLKILIASAGGTVVVMLAFSRRIFNVIESRIISGLQNALDKDLEKFKALTDNKKHVTQYRFNEEYKILTKLYGDYYEFTKLCWDVYCKADDESIVSSFALKCDEFTSFFFKHRPFINQNIADEFEKAIVLINEYRNKALHVREMRIRYHSATDSAGYETHVVKNAKRLIEIHDEINTGEDFGVSKMETLIRKYLDSLEVVR